MRLVAIHLALAGALLAAPSHAADYGFRCSARGGTEWSEYRSAHFVVATDLAAGMASSLVEDLEQMRAYLVVAIFRAPTEIPGRVRVVAFRDPDQLVALTGQKSVAGFYSQDWFGEPLAVISGDGLQASRTLVAHELAHHLSWFAFPRQPAWFAEGLAEFLETVASQGQELKGTVGLAPKAYIEATRRVSPVPAAELLAWKGQLDAEEPGRHHRYSWLLFHYLTNARPKEFGEFQRRLAAAEDPAAAWRAAFPEWDPKRPETLSTLDDALQAHRRVGKFWVLKLEATADATFERVPLPSAEVHALRLLIGRARRGDRGEEVRAEVEEGLKEDPTHPILLVARAGSREARVAALRAATGARPGDWRALAFLATSLDEAQAAEREKAFRRAVELAPQSTHALNGLAWELLKAGRSGEALPLARRAAAMAPWNYLILDTYAAVAADVGLCQVALATQHRAVDLWAKRDDRGADLEKRLAAYEEQCAGVAR